MNEKQQPLFDTGDRRILAVLFAAGEPLELERLAEGLGVDKAALRQALERLQGRLQEAFRWSCWSWRRAFSSPPGRSTAS